MSTAPDIPSRRRWLSLASALVFLTLFGVGPFLLAQSGAPQPKLYVDDDCAAFAFSPDNNRIVYAVRRLMSTKRYDIERDDLWSLTFDGKKQRIVNGEKLVRGPVAFSYAIRALRWSPDGQRLTVEMLTSQIIDERGNTKDGQLTDLMDANGKEIKIQGGDSAIDDALQAAWLGDGVTVTYLQEAAKPNLLYTLHSVRPVAGRGGILFEGRTFSAVAWDAQRNAAAAIERDRSLSGPIHLVWLDLLKQTARDLGVLDGFAGHLTVSPSATKIAYFRDGDTLEVREVAQPDRATKIPLAFGRYEWMPDERRLLIKRGPARESGDLFWVTLSDGKVQPALQGLIYHDFAVSPDGHWVAVTEPGKRRLLVFPAE